MNIIIPLGGKGERFTKEGYDLPKPLIKIYDKEMILHVLDNMSFCEEDRIFIIYKYELDEYDFKKIIQTKYPQIYFIPIHYQTSGAVETVLFGLEHVKNCSPHKMCALFDCDTFYTTDILAIIRDKKINQIFYVERENDLPIYSYILLDNNDKIIDIKEKIKISSNANTGCYVFKDIDIFMEYCNYVIDNKITFNGEPYMSCVISEMIKKEELFYGVNIEGSFVFSLGTPSEIRAYLKNTHCWLFDLDGTVVNTDHVYFSVWETILQKFNILLTKDIFKKYIHGNNDTIVIKTLLPAISSSVKQISELKDQLFTENISQLTLIDGADGFLKYLTSMGNKCAIVTNCNRYTAEKILDFFKLNKYIDFIVVGNECHKPKPSPDPYLFAMEKYNTTPDKCIIIEDSNSGLLSGRLANPHCLIGITTNYSKSELISNGANIVINDYVDIPYLSECFKEINIDDYVHKLESYIQQSKIIYDESIIEVAINNVKLKGGFISDVLAVVIKTASKKLDCIIKLENTHETPLSLMASTLDLYHRENYFYENISRYVNICIPTFYGLIKNDHFHTIGILMENLYSKGNFIVNLDLNTANIDVSLKIIDRISNMHIQFWNKNLDQCFPQLKRHNDPLFCPTWKNLIDNKWLEFKSKWKNLIGSFDIGDKIVKNFNDIQKSLSVGQLTLVHGDVKSPNIFYDKNNDYEPYFIDWQYICIGKGIQDIVFFLIESFSIEKMVLYFPMFIHYYFIKLKQGGIHYSIDDYKMDIKNAISYFPFFVAIWFGTTPEDLLIDKNFPFFFIQKLFYLLERMDHLLDSLCIFQ